MAGDDVGVDCFSETTPHGPCSSTSYGLLHSQMTKRHEKKKAGSWLDRQKSLVINVVGAKKWASVGFKVE